MFANELFRRTGRQVDAEVLQSEITLTTGEKW